MKVVNLAGKQFVLACEELACKITSLYSPDIMISIKTGGAYVGKQILEKMDNSDVKYAEVMIQRGHTRRKEKKWIHIVIKKIPKFLADWIRIGESATLYIKSRLKKPVRSGEIQFREDIINLLREGGKNILLVDDSIDSGASMEFLHSYLKKTYPSNTIKIAVIAVTTNNPIIDADFYIYHNWTQARFPWSHDA
jgi:hypoxanthine phosphoribosyltransferase